MGSSLIIRPLSKFHLFAKMILFGILIAKFFNHMCTYAFKIWQSICSKTIHFFKQSKFRKRSIEVRGFGAAEIPVESCSFKDNASLSRGLIL